MYDSALSVPAKIDCPFRKKIENERTATIDSGTMNRPGTIDKPSSLMAIEFRVSLQRHDHVDFPFGMGMPRPHDVSHLDDVHTIALKIGARVYNPTIFYPAMFVCTHPSGRYRLMTGSSNVLKLLAMYRKPLIEKIGQSIIQRHSFNFGCNPGNQSLKRLRCHFPLQWKNLPFEINQLSEKRRQLRRLVHRGASLQPVRHVSDGRAPALVIHQALRRHRLCQALHANT